jgi:hypothetical protein
MSGSCACGGDTLGRMHVSLCLGCTGPGTLARHFLQGATALHVAGGWVHDVHFLHRDGLLMCGFAGHFAGVCAGLMHATHQQALLCALSAVDL